MNLICGLESATVKVGGTTFHGPIKRVAADNAFSNSVNDWFEVYTSWDLRIRFEITKVNNIAFDSQGVIIWLEG
jgi:hypothetical protein